MLKCKDCQYFSSPPQEEEKGYCRGHAASVQFVSPEMDIEECPIKKFEPKK